MGNKFQITYIAIAVTLFVLVISIPASFSDLAIGKGSATDPLAFIALGSADGKSYYAETARTMNWTSAVTYCQDNGYQLASMQTSNQVNVIKDAFVEFELGGRWFWTAARESKLPSMYVWNDLDNSPPDVSLFDNWTFRSDYHYCAELTVVDFNRTTMLGYDCANWVYVLCEG